MQPGSGSLKKNVWMYPDNAIEEPITRYKLSSFNEGLIETWIDDRTMLGRVIPPNLIKLNCNHSKSKAGF